MYEGTTLKKGFKEISFGTGGLSIPNEKCKLSDYIMLAGRDLARAKAQHWTDPGTVYTLLCYILDFTS